MTYKTHPTLNGEALLLLWQLPLCFCHVLGHFVLALLNRTHNLVVTTLHVQAGKYTVFGHVIDGMDVLDKMEKVPTGELYSHRDDKLVALYVSLLHQSLCERILRLGSPDVHIIVCSLIRHVRRMVAEQCKHACMQEPQIGHRRRSRSAMSPFTPTRWLSEEHSCCARGVRVCDVLYF